MNPEIKPALLLRMIFYQPDKARVLPGVISFLFYDEDITLQIRLVLYGN